MIGRKAYRASRSAIVPGWACATGFFLIGVVTAASSPGHPGKGGTSGVVLGVIVGTCAALLGLLMGAMLARYPALVARELTALQADAAAAAVTSKDMTAGESG